VNEIQREYLKHGIRMMKKKKKKKGYVLKRKVRE